MNTLTVRHNICAGEVLKRPKRKNAKNTFLLKFWPNTQYVFLKMHSKDVFKILESNWVLCMYRNFKGQFWGKNSHWI